MEEWKRLVATLGVFFGVVGYADHFGDGDGVEAAEGICDARVGQLAVPFVLDASDFAGLVEDIDLAGDCRLFSNTLDFVEGGHVHLDRVAGGGDAVGFALDFGEGGLQTVPLRLKLFPALGYGDRVGEDGIVFPELQFGERWSAGEQVKHRGDKSPLFTAEVDAGCGLDIGVFELELAGAG